jgi:peroxiredoxin
MRSLCGAVLAISVLVGGAQAADPPKQAPKVTLKSPDGKQSYDLAKLTADGPVLVRLTCACSGCDQEVGFFQKLQAAYDSKGLKTLAVFQGKPEEISQYVVKKDIRFLWLNDPKGECWKIFDTKTMPTNILIDKGGEIVKILPGCTRDGKNAQVLSSEIAKLLKTQEVQIAEAKTATKK